MDELVFKGANDQAITNSLLVAEKFGKEHRHVLDAIRELVKGCAENSAIPMFEETTYVNSQNKQEYPMFIMNRDGFTLLSMGFTGKKALQFKLDYINAFNTMEKAIRTPVGQPLSPIEMQLEMMKSMQLQLQELIDTKEEVKQLKSELADVRQRTTTELEASTIVAYVTRNHIKLDVTKYGAMGRKATSLCKKRGIEVTKINDVRWGTVSVYPDSVLEEVFNVVR